MEVCSVCVDGLCLARLLCGGQGGAYVGNSPGHFAHGFGRCCGLFGRSWSRVSGRHRSNRLGVG